MITQNIIGQSPLISRMERMLSSGRIVHAYLFTGAAGAGKRTLSDLFAQSLICTGEGDKPCHVCHACIQFKTGNHPDIIRIQREKDKTGVSIDQIRNMQDELKVKPYQAGRRICIIEDAHTLKDQAQNALLKTLEEPPANTLIFLLAENTNAVLPTILSRCQTLRVDRLSRNEAAQILMDRLKLPRDEALVLAALSQGNPGKALSLAEDEDYRSKRASLLEGMKLAGTYKILDLAAVFIDNKEKYDELLDVLVLWARDLLLLHETNTADLIINVDKISMLNEQSKVFTSKALQDIIELIEKSRKIIKSNGNYQLTIENMLLGFSGRSNLCSS